MKSSIAAGLAVAVGCSLGHFILQANAASSLSQFGQSDKNKNDKAAFMTGVLGHPPGHFKICYVREFTGSFTDFRLSAPGINPQSYPNAPKVKSHLLLLIDPMDNNKVQLAGYAEFPGYEKTLKTDGLGRHDSYIGGNDYRWWWSFSHAPHGMVNPALLDTAVDTIQTDGPHPTGAKDATQNIGVTSRWVKVSTPDKVVTQCTTTADLCPCVSTGMADQTVDPHK